MKKGSGYLFLFAVLIFLGGRPAGAQVLFGRGDRLCDAVTVKEKPLFAAARHSDGAAIARLLKEGASPEATDDCGIPLIAYAVGAVNLEMLTALIDAGANVDRVIAFHAPQSPLLRLIDRLPTEPDETKRIHEAIELLIARGAAVNVRDGAPESPLIEAVKAGDRRVVEALLRAGAEVDRPDDDGRTAYSYAVQNGNLDLKNVLLAAGADRARGVDGYRRRWGADAFFQAAADGRTDVVEALLAAGVDPNLANTAGSMTALMRATELSTVEALLAAGAAIERRDNAGFTALVWAAALGREQVVVRLIAAGADVNARNRDGRGALDFARSPAIRTALAKAGAR